MRLIARIVVFCAIMWVAAWGAVWLGLSQGIPAWLSAREAEGWQAEVGDLAISGFPLSVVTDLSDVALADPETGLAWRTPGLTATSQLYAPTAVRVVFPPSQVVASPLEKITVTSEVMEAALSLAARPDLTLRDAEIRLHGIGLSSDQGWTAALQSGTLLTRQVTDAPLSYDISFAARGARPSTDALRAVEPAGLLPDVFERMNIDARLAFDTPWDRHAIEDRRPQITGIDLTRLTARWGEMEVEAAGMLDVDADGRPEGRITLRAINWRDMLAVSAGNGWVPPGMLSTVERALGVLADLSGNPDTIDVPLSFQNGFFSLGPVPLGPAPRFVIR